MNREQLKQYITETYHTNADYPWTNAPDDMVFRHQNNRKWFALVMKISKQKLGLSQENLIDICALPSDRGFISFKDCTPTETNFFTHHL